MLPSLPDLTGVSRAPADPRVRLAGVSRIFATSVASVYPHYVAKVESGSRRSMIR